MENYVSNLVQEIERQHRYFKIKPKTIYLGGGTPSLLLTAQINEIISAFGTKICEEITLECNPQNIDEKFVKNLKNTKINRISLGVQSFLDYELKTLGRLHGSEKIYSSFKLLRQAEIENISVDLIYGLPNQKQKDVEFSVEKIIQLSPEHISIYCLSLEKKVPLFDRKSQIPNDEDVSKFYYLIRKKLLKAGYFQYEISNFAKKGFESKHNLSYWNDEYYLGFGSSAASYFEKKMKVYRCTNSADIASWQKNRKCVESSHKQQEQEFIFLGLRKSEGINLLKYKNKFKKEFEAEYKKVLHKFDKNLVIKDGYLKLTPQTYFISNEIFLEFM